MSQRKLQRKQGGDIMNVVEITADEVLFIDSKSGRATWANLYDQHGDARFKFY